MFGSTYAKSEKLVQKHLLRSPNFQTDLKTKTRRFKYQHGVLDQTKHNSFYRSLSLYLLNLIHLSFHRILLSVYCTLGLKTLSTLFLFNFFVTPFFFFIFLHFLTIQTPSHSFNSPKSPCGLSHWSSGNSQLTFIGSLFILPTFSDFP